MLWARMARASQAEVARECAWLPNLCYRIADSALENSLSNGCPVEQRQGICKEKQLRERLRGACLWYAIGDQKFFLLVGWSAKRKVSGSAVRRRVVATLLRCAADFAYQCWRSI